MDAGGLAMGNKTAKTILDSFNRLIVENDFHKITVEMIMKAAEVSRATFYRHFKDKYDLVNWIFDVEFFSVIEQNESYSAWNFMENLCVYLYENKKFYKCALKIRGQNSFEEHFIELLIPIMESNIREILNEEDAKIDEVVLEFHINFCIDAFVGVIKRWIQDSKDIKPEDFLAMAKSTLHMISTGLKKENI